ncbi:trimeric intracellular cation channel family protein [Sutterella sp.]|uniref:trimeric intracellular cation channel family protein n=1 Tax=Sutterella sp. TaxID=1981025 RepID=UPI0026E06CEA|nr:trimeric intracellular cation channel family protein [Sutterella sp.]MDO5531515.1 trimeric intracellular cation channel family protein [Sutterella sp.]
MFGEPVFAALAQTTELFDTVGILGFALAGILAAQGRGVDPVGVFILAFTSAFGGVTVRDLLLDLRPFYWVRHDAIVWVLLIVTIFAPRIVKRFSRPAAHEVFLWADAVGLGIFCASGTVLAWEKGLAPLSCSLVGVASGILGGIMRDVLLNRMPSALSDRKPYGLAGFIGCWIGIILLSDDVRPQAATFVTAFTIVLLRMITLKLNWEIRYSTSLAQKIFPGNGPISLSRILRRKSTDPARTAKTAPRQQSRPLPRTERVKHYSVTRPANSSRPVPRDPRDPEKPDGED